MTLREEFRELFASAEPEHPEFERFSVPHQFQPRMSLGAAAYAATIALARIFLGSMLFAVWGSCIWTVWATLPNPFWRCATLAPLIAGLAVTMALLMIGISVCARRLKSWSRRGA